MDTTLTLSGGDVLTPSGQWERADVRVEAGRITEVRRLPGAEPATRIDVTGCVVLPGLIDAHIHLSLAGVSALPPASADIALRAAANLAPVLESGVTTVCDLGGYDGVAVALGRATARADLPGPRIIAANRILCTTGGHTSGFHGVGLECDGADGVRRAVRDQIKQGAGVIKVALNSGRNVVETCAAELSTAVEEAHRHGLRVAAHASVREAVALAVECGVDTVQHGNGADGPLLRRMADDGVVLVPTSWAFREGARRARAARDAATTPDPDADRLVTAWEMRVAQQERLLVDAREAGVVIAAGTDALDGSDAAAMPQELRAVMALGLTEEQALLAATTGGAAALADDGRGRVAPGAVADLVVVRTVPGAVVEALSSPQLVVQDGRVVVDSRVAV